MFFLFVIVILLCLLLYTEITKQETDKTTKQRPHENKSNEKVDDSEKLSKEWELKEEKMADPRYTTAVKVINVSDEEIDYDVFSEDVINEIKQLAADVAASINKPFDKLKLEGLKAGKYYEFDFQIDGWIVEEYLCQDYNYENTGSEPLLDVYRRDHYYVLEKDGYLKVYVINIVIKSVDINKSTWSSSYYAATYEIKKHDVSYTWGIKNVNQIGEELISNRSIITLDYAIPYQREPIIVGNELRVFNRFIENGKYRTMRKKNNRNGDGIKEKLMHLKNEDVRASNTSR